jgi:flagellar M-ring protein FliF
MAATTETTADGTAAPQPPETTVSGRLREALARLTNQQKILLMIALAAIVAIIAGSTLYSRQPDYKVLFSNLSERDGGAIITSLEQLNIPYRFPEGGGAILIPADKVHEVRLRLASQGLPKGGSVGFELMENQKFGISQFAEQVNYQRALEGELARTIQSITSVASARVHLAIPKPSVFVREEQKPTASVLLQLHPGRQLEPAQVAGIQHLISSSVPQLPLNNVNIIDQSGNMLQLKSKLIDAGLDPTQIKYVQEIENSVIKRLEDILAPVVGPDNARVQVAADVDFSLTEQTSENFKPNVTPPDVSIRSQQSTETASVTAPVAGVPGALSNQPPVPAVAPITNPAVPGQGGTASTATTTGPGQINVAGLQAPVTAAGQPLNSRKDSTINYEVDKTVRYTKQSIGAIKRLSVAVVVNQKKGTDKAGKTIAVPLTEQEMKQITDLAREAMGFSKERGDSLSVANAPFNLPEKVEYEVPLWKQPETVSFAKDLIKYALIAAIIVTIYIIVLKPILRSMFPPPPEPEIVEPDMFEEENEEEGSEHPLIPPFEVKLQEARDLAAKNPEAVAGIIKDWLGVNNA